MRTRTGLAASTLAVVNIFAGCSSTSPSASPSGADGAAPAGSTGSRAHDADSAAGEASTPPTPADGGGEGGAQDSAGPGAVASPDAALDATLDGGAPGDGSAAVDESGRPPPVEAGASVLQRQKSPGRDGNYVDPAMTRAAVAKLHADPAFANPMLDGPVYAQPLYVENGAAGRETIYVATDQNKVYAFDAATGSSIWQKQVGTPVPMAAFACANIDPVGITGTPVIDLASRTIFVDASTTTDDGTTKFHLVYGLSIDDGTVRPGYPIDIAKALAAKGVTFNPAYEQQRGALTILQGNVYVPYGGYSQDCGDYLGFVVGVPIANPAEVIEWHPAAPARYGGVWGPGGPATDGTSLFVGTGNTDTNISMWGGGEGVVRLTPSLAFSGSSDDFFTPSNWEYLDMLDYDLGANQPIVLDVPGAAHPKLVIAMGKSGVVHVLDRTKLGGIGKGDGVFGEGLASALFTPPDGNLPDGGKQISLNNPMSYIINAPAAFTTPSGTYVVFKSKNPPGSTCPDTTTLVAAKIDAGASPRVALAWCASPDSTGGSPAASTTDGSSDAVVWMLGADGDGRVHAFNGETGELLSDGDPGLAGPAVARYQSPIIVKGRVIWASNTQLFAETVK